MIAQQLSSRRGQVALIAGAFLLSFLIGLSRIYLGVHYPTDVLAGWSAGTAWAIICSAVLIWWEQAGGQIKSGIRGR
jgi:undecaprenyl-diphosphatase